MRVLLITDWNAGRGGAEAYASQLLEGLRAAGDEVRLLTSDAGSAGDGAAEFVAATSENTIGLALRQIWNPSAVEAVRQARAEFDPEVVWVNMFAHHLSPAVLAAVSDLPTVMTVSDYKLVCPVGSKLLPDGSICQHRAGWVCRSSGCVTTLHWLRDVPRYALIRRGLQTVDNILACSSYLVDELVLGGLQAEKEFVPVAACSDGYQRALADRPRFLFVGRLDREKGLEILIDAFTEVVAQEPHADLRIAGQGPLEAHLRQLVVSRDLGARVSFLGWLEPDEVEAELASAWALVAPSLWAEPLGLVAPEALIRGVPVIASTTGGFAETVEEGVSGLLVPNGDSAALASALMKVLRREVFPGGSIPEASRAESQRLFGVERHILTMRSVFARSILGASS